MDQPMTHIALEEEIRAAEIRGRAEGKAEGKIIGKAIGKARGRAIGEAIGKAQIDLEYGKVINFSYQQGHLEWIAEFKPAHISAEKFIKIKKSLNCK